MYPTVAEGVFAMTNRIVASVMKVSKGAASVTRLAMDKEKGCGEVKFFWERKTGGISELIECPAANGCLHSPSYEERRYFGRSKIPRTTVKSNVDSAGAVLVRIGISDRSGWWLRVPIR